MRRTLVIIFLLLLIAVPAAAQSGRRTPPAPQPTPAPSPDAERLQLVKSDKPLPPQFVDGERIYVAREVDQRARITSKPAPVYTREARRHKTRGTVVVRAVLAADRTVKHIEVKTGLPDGLSDKAVEAARQLRFMPAIKDGKPVSVWVEVEYRFNIY